ncbi:FAD-binding oxidoreductase [Sphingomonas sp.]|uniref:NAD(P)/FAD-dependent oxidoreductase n=1 Tax=Sphingomonas sp. TaxID=28214 RepID=UPI000DB26CC8|nr:FAD-dependent oxidoreductase [Sphingomonas sp.]PZU06334.1 MAG: FAD-dependent oxidoreductase [Sphingomonas sp.]
MTFTESRDLRTGDVPWQETDWPSRPSDFFPADPIDIAILGSGIVGAVIADRLSDGRRRIALFDRRPPGCGSTAASTAEIMWAMDVPMSHLARNMGEAEAVRRWRRVHEAVRDFAYRIDALGIEAGRIERPTLYLAGTILGEDGLAREAEMHRRHGLPSTFLRGEETQARFDIAPRAAIASQGGFEIEPVRLCHAMLDRACRKGATLTWPVDIAALHPADGGVRLETDDGRTCHARDVILATGYERAPLFLPPVFGLHSTFAIATPPGRASLWREQAMIWEASDPYLYVRTDRRGRIIAGGEDIDSSDEAGRDALLGAKAGTIAAKLETMLQSGPIAIDRRWTATFGSSPDGLPAIGPVATMPNVWMAAGYGGNGIAFASLAAQMLERELGGEPDPDRDCFSPYRFD